MKYVIIFENRADKDIKAIIKSGNKGSIDKLLQILEELEETPKEGVGNPEELKGNLLGFWSRRINKKDRLIYKIEEEEITVIVVSALGHYGDK
jgi:toxin YoeB